MARRNVYACILIPRGCSLIHRAKSVLQPACGRTVIRASSQEQTKNKFNNPKEALRNIEIMEHNADIISLINKLDFKLKRLYIKTKPAREYIIEHDRISLDSIQPSKPYTFLNRAAIFLKKIHII